MAFAIWITGLPGSGKSTVGRELAKYIKDVDYLRLDELRKKYVLNATFSDDEREMVYSRFIDDGVSRIAQGRNVIYDATAYRMIWRLSARSKIEHFIEVYVRCPIGKCIERETSRKDGLVQAELYKKAMDRKNTGRQYENLGKVVGIDVPYEADPDAEVIIDSDRTKPEDAAKIIADVLKKKGWI